MAERALHGRGVVVTRPLEQAAGLKNLIMQAGGEAFVFPALEIRAIADPRGALATLDRLERFDLAVFASANAVRMAFRLMHERRPGWHWPPALPAAGVGGATRQALADAGVGELLPAPASADTEGLLALRALNEVRGKRVALFRGRGGRALLGDTLAARGAQVSYVECYERCLPAYDPAPLLELLRAARVDAFTVSSAEGLVNLCRFAGADRVRRLPFFLPHRRVAGKAAELGLERCIVAGPDDAEMLRALVAYFDGAK